ncbi:DUF2325 domain-containing protein [Lysinibacillus sp. CNPSo 3705]|uniref:DUF2325 domain-containing protein n=1 Tax=Lysinibacillus sp. CNPSo 3705 TaxID=3028148 RepID=UPI0023641B1C|nr:DUF2325 domain-containing protein [Lysinibacillus sp. CNPSo 3705]MDD1505320.1 DUF2325 domain-containing protein [Lysinibacillus sp. CNPSo 3705]
MKNKPTITIIGGSQENTFKKVGAKKGCDILFHNGKDRMGKGRNTVKNTFLPIIKKGDCVVVLLGACSHPTMNMVKELCRELKVNIIFQNGFGASAAITNGLAELGKTA